MHNKVRIEIKKFTITSDGLSDVNVCIAGSQLTRWCSDLIEVNFHNNVKRYKKACRTGIDFDGRHYVNLFATPGGNKLSTVIFINELYHADIWLRINCDRNPQLKLQAAKLNAYMALTASSSVPVCGFADLRFAVVADTSSVVNAVVRYNKNGRTSDPAADDISITPNDGFGLMRPDMARAFGDKLGYPNTAINGVVRGPWLKGMLIPVPFDEFADERGVSIFTDVWGNSHDIHDIDVIFTESQVKLWKAYPDAEAYRAAAVKYGYELCFTKTSALQLRGIRTTNYQFLQDFALDEDAVAALCKPTIDRINATRGGDWASMALYLNGSHHLTTKSNAMVRALALDHTLANDRYFRGYVNRLKEREILDARKGKLDVHGDYTMMCGDPIYLLESMFGLELTGAIPADHCCHCGVNAVGAPYFADDAELLLFRAPMITLENVHRATNIARPALLRYCNNVCFLSAHDLGMVRMSGADFDGDLCLATDNAVLRDHFELRPTIICDGASADKVICTDEALQDAIANGFGNKVGHITNIGTALICLRDELRARGEQDSVAELQRMIDLICDYQQQEIDSVKTGKHPVIPDDINNAASLQPYFFVYVYEETKEVWDKYASKLKKMSCHMAHTLAYAVCPDYKELYDAPPLNTGRGTINKIAWHCEKNLPTNKHTDGSLTYDISALFEEHPDAKEQCAKLMSDFIGDKLFRAITQDDDNRLSNDEFYEKWQTRVDEIGQDVVAANVSDPSFLWQFCGDAIVAKLAETRTYEFPTLMTDGEVAYAGNAYDLICYDDID